MNALTRIASLLILTLATMLIGACSKAGEIHVTKSLETKLDQFPTVHITARGVTPKTTRASRKFQKILADRLTKEGVFKGVDENAGLVLRCKITQMDYGDELKRELSLKGKAKVTIEIKITEPDGKMLGHITAVAKTTRKNDKDQPAVRVLGIAADAIVDYMKEHGSKKGSSPAAGANAKQDASKTSDSPQDKPEDEVLEDELLEDEEVGDEAEEKSEGEDS